MTAVGRAPKPVSWFVAGVLALLLAGGCTLSKTVHPTPAQVAGTYRYGDGIGFAETLLLRPDGEFECTHWGHLGQDDRVFRGTWRLEGARIAFVDAALPTGQPPLHPDLLTQTYGKQMVLVPSRYEDGSSVNEDFVYRKQP